MGGFFMRKIKVTRLLSCLLAVLFAIPAAVICAPKTYAADGADAFIAVAASEINYYEEENGYTKYGVAYAQPNLEKWDCAFLCWCAREAGLSSDLIPNYTDVLALQSFYKSQGLYHVSYAHGSDYSPKPGDIAFFSLTSATNALTSCGLVTKVSAGIITVVEGNCPNRVRENTYDFYNKAIIGFASPAYLPSSASARTVEPGAKTYAPGIYSLNDDMNLRQSASLNAAVLTVIPSGTVVLVDKVNGEWGHTTHEGKEGWMSLNFSTVIGDAESKYLIGKYRTDYNMNFRSTAAELDNNIVGMIPLGTVITVTEISGTWGKTTYGGKTGWVSLVYCTQYTPGNNEPVTTPQTGENAEVDWLVIDISRHNAVGNFNWAKMKAAGLQGVIIRVGGRGYGPAKELYDDTAFYQHYLGAKAAGLHVGAYFFSYALSEKEALEEAQMTINILRSCNAQLDMPVYIDMEDYAESDDEDHQHYNAGRAVCTKVADTFCKKIKEAGYYPGIYTNISFSRDLLDVSVFEGRAVWVAQYNSVCTFTLCRYGMWQYTNMGKLNGYTGQYLDMNRCYVNYPALIAGTATNPGHTDPNPTPARPEEPTTNPNTPDTTPTVQRDWELTKAATCTEDGIESIFSGEQLYMKRTVRAQHGTPVNCVLRNNSVTLTAGQSYDVKANAEQFYDETNAAYAARCDEVKNNGGCLFSYCPTCGEILSVVYHYKSSCRHDFQEQTVSAATCTKEGVKLTVCSKCGKTGTEEVLPRNEHSVGSMQYHEGNGSPSYYGILCGQCGTVTYASYNLIAGDVDGNFKVEAADARLALRHAIGLEQIGLEYQKNADYDKNGSIEPADARLILRKSVNLEA